MSKKRPTSSASKRSVSTKSKAIPPRRQSSPIKYHDTADIHISVTGLENVPSKFKATEYIVQAEFLGIVIGESPQQPGSADTLIDHHFHCLLRYFPEEPRCIQDLIGNPVVFNVYQVEGIYDTENIYPKVEPAPSVVSTKVASKIRAIHSKRKVKSDKQTSQKSNSTKVTKIYNQEIIGRCCVDLLPLLLGETAIQDSFPIYPDYRTLDDQLTTHPNLPRIHVNIQSNHTPLPSSGSVLQFCVESIYNIAATMNETFYYTLGVFLPISQSPVLVRDGVVNREPEFEKPKIWDGLAGLTSRAANTNFFFDKNPDSIKNTDIDFRKALELCPQERIEWNIMKRCWLSAESKIAFTDQLKKHRLLGIEIFGSREVQEREIIVNKTEEDEIPLVTPSRRPKVPVVTSQDIHLMGFIDVTKLLYAGETKTRVGCQLELFNPTIFFQKTGHESIFKEPVPLVLVNQVPNPTTNSGQDKSTKLYSSLGLPTFIILELELSKPLYKKRTIEDLTQSLRLILPERTDPPLKMVQLNLADEDFEKCIEDVLEILNNEYGVFVKQNDGSDFSKFLNDTGVFMSIKTEIKNKLLFLISEKFPYTGDVDDMANFDDYINKIYVYVTKKIMGVIQSTTSAPEKVNENLLYYAKEAEENLDFRLANRYYLEHIDMDSNNPDSWLQFAVFQQGTGDLEGSYQSCLKCITLDMTHKYGVLFVALLMVQKEMLKEAEVALLSLVSNYAEWVEGWISLHLFYGLVNNFEGADVAYEKALKCSKAEKLDENQQSVFVLSSSELSWNTKFWRKSEIFARAAVLYLQLRCFEFAQQALAQVLLSNNKSYSYYNAVGFYLTNRYDKAIASLDHVLRIHGPDLTVGGLLAHCQYRLKKYESAYDLYDSLLSTYDRPNDILLIYTRLVYILKNRNDLEKALKIVLLACKYCPTPNVWLQAGILYYELKNWRNAELCLNEANLLDVKGSLTWEYLGKVNGKIGNMEVKELCETFSKKYEPNETVVT